ncbi:MAG: alpha/beta fold hydrolase, partial [Actinomycetota bacterium]
MWSETIDIDGVSVHRSGGGPALVLLHANGGDANDFKAIVDHLEHNHTVFGVDWPGWGESEASEEPTALGYAELLPRILDQLPGGPFTLLGNSVGGFAAIRTAADRPDLVQSLVLIDPGGFTPNWFGTRLACLLIGSSPLAPWMMRVLPHFYLHRRTEAVRAILAHAKELSHDQA